MPKLYEYETNYHRTTEKLAVRECGQGIYIGVNSVVQMPFGEEDEQTTSIVIPFTEVQPLVEGLLQSVNKDDHVVLKLTGTQLRQIIASIELSVEVLECEVNQADMPYDLIEMLKTESDNLLQRDKQSKKDA